MGEKRESEAAVFPTVHQFNGKRGTAIEILRLRGTEIMKKIVEMDVSVKGLSVHPDVQVPAKCKLT